MNAQVENAEQALVSVNAASGTARGLFTGFMFLTGYLAVVLASTNDLQLFLYTPIKLPFFNIDIDIKGFYTIMPWLYLIIHANMLLIFAFLTDKINHLEAQLQPLYYEQRQGLMKRLHVLIFAQYLSKQHPGTMAWIIAMIVWFSIAFVPLLLLLWMQLDFLPAQEENVIWGQRTAVAVDVGLILYFWNNILQKRRRSLLPDNWDLPFWKRYTLGGYVLSLISIACLCLSLFIVVIPFSGWDKCLTGNDPEDVQRIKSFKSINKLNDFDTEEDIEQAKKMMGWRNSLRTHFFAVMPFKQWLELEEQIITANEIDAEVKNKLIELRSGENVELDKIKGKLIGYNARKTPNLRFAYFDDSILIKADLRKASLQGADLLYASLQGASLLGASLQGADLSGAFLQGASLNGASLQGADLFGATLQGANLKDASLQGASLYGASLQGADLRYASLQGADLTEADISLAKFNEDQPWTNNEKQSLITNMREQPLEAENIDKIVERIETAWREQTLKDSFAKYNDCVRTETFSAKFQGLNECEHLTDNNLTAWHRYFQKRSEFIAELLCREPSAFKPNHFYSYYSRFISASGEQIQAQAGDFYLPTWHIYLFAALDEKIKDDSSCENKEKIKQLWQNDIGNEKLELLRARAENRAKEEIIFN